MKARRGLLLPLAFASGGCALVYQVVWTRELRLVFGASTLASAAVVAIFVGGLGLGAWKLGQRAERSSRPLFLYAVLELGVALSVVASLFSLPLVSRLYERLGGSVVLGPTGATLVRLLLSALVLGIPTALMGGTLPALARAAIPRDGDDPERRSVALLYGLNTLGAVVGCCSATFWLVENVGALGTMFFTAMLNAVVALLAYLAWLWAPELGLEPPEGPPIDSRPRQRPYAPRAFVLGASATVGFAYFLVELVFYRMLVPLTGGTVYTFGLVLATALAGIGLGGAAYGTLFARRHPTLGSFATICLLEAVGLAAPYALGDRVALLAVGLRALGSLGFGGHVAGWIVVTAVVVLPASLAAGVQFPMLVALLGRGRAGVARDVGLAYAWNTLGAIGGSIAGGFGLMRVLTAPGCWRMAAELLLAAGMAAVALAASRSPGRSRWLGAAWRLALAAGVVVLLRSVGPTAVWRHEPIGAGRVPVSKIESRNAVEDFLRDSRRAIVWQADGIESTVALHATNGYAFIVNAKSDGHCRQDAGTQVMGGLLGALLQGQPRSAMVIGLGSGSSAGWLARVPSIERVDVAELEPAMLEVARRCAPVNEDALDNPKVHVQAGDGRELLSVSPKTYDVVFSEPSNPYRAGVASLYTLDFYRRVLQHLSDGGVFVQWLQAYEIDTPTMKTLLATVGRAFPSVEVWQLRDPDLALVASRAPLPKDVAALRARIATEPFAKALRVAWGVEDLEGVLGHFVAGRGLVAALAADRQVPTNTDDRPIVEFAFARAVNRADPDSDVPDAEVVRFNARWTGRGADKPELAGGETIDWSRVDLERGEIAPVDEQKPRSAPSGVSEDVDERLDFERAYQQGDEARALAAWDRHPREPATRTEVLDLARAAVETHDARAPAWVDRLAAQRPVEAMVLRAQLAEDEKRRDDAVALLVPALLAYRTDAWLSPGVLFDAMTLAYGIAYDRGPAAEQILEVLQQPFALEMYRDERLKNVIEIAERLDRQRRCREVLAAVEPDVFWSQPILRYRRDCYQATADVRWKLAQQELDAYEAQRPHRFDW